MPPPPQRQNRVAPGSEDDDKKKKQKQYSTAAGGNVYDLGDGRDDNYSGGNVYDLGDGRDDNHYDLASDQPGGSPPFDGTYDNAADVAATRDMYEALPEPPPRRSSSAVTTKSTGDDTYLAPVSLPNSTLPPSNSSAGLEGTYDLGGEMGGQVLRSEVATTRASMQQPRVDSKRKPDLGVDDAKEAQRELRRAQQQRRDAAEKEKAERDQQENLRRNKLQQIAHAHAELETQIRVRLKMLDEEFERQVEGSSEASAFNPLMHQIMLLQGLIHQYYLLSVEAEELHGKVKSIAENVAFATVKEVVQRWSIESESNELSFFLDELGRFLPESEASSAETETKPKPVMAAAGRVSRARRVSSVAAGSRDKTTKLDKSFFVEKDQSVDNYRAPTSTGWMDRASKSSLCARMKAFVTKFLNDAIQARELDRLDTQLGTQVDTFNKMLLAYLQQFSSGMAVEDEGDGPDKSAVVFNPVFDGDDNADVAVDRGSAQYLIVGDDADDANFGFDTEDKKAEVKPDGDDAQFGFDGDASLVDLEKGDAAQGEVRLFEQFYSLVQTARNLVQLDKTVEETRGSLTGLANEQFNRLLAFAGLGELLFADADQPERKEYKASLKTLFIKALHTLTPPVSHRKRNTVIGVLLFAALAAVAAAAALANRGGGGDGGSPAVAEAQGQGLIPLFQATCALLGDIPALNLSPSALIPAATALIGQQLLYRANRIENSLRGAVARWAGLANTTGTVSDGDKLGSTIVFYDANAAGEENFQLDLMTITHNTAGERVVTTRVLAWENGEPVCEEISRRLQVLTYQEATKLDVDIPVVNAVNQNVAAERIPLGFTTDFNPETKFLFTAQVRSVVNGELVHKVTGKRLGTLVSPGIYSVALDDIANLAFNPADGFDGQVTPALHLTAIQDGRQLGEVSKSVELNFVVPVVLTPPDISVSPVIFNEDSQGSFDYVAFAEAGAALNKTISDIPAGFTLRAGGNVFVASPEITSVDVSQWDERITIIPPENYNGSPDLTLTVTAVLDDPVLGFQEETAVDTLRVTVHAIADEPVIVVAQAVTVNEDALLELPVEFILRGLHEQFITNTVTGLPAGTELTDGNLNFKVQADNVPVSLLGMNTKQLKIKFPPNYKGNDAHQLELTFDATVREGNSVASKRAVTGVNFTPVADVVPIVVQRNFLVVEAGLDGIPPAQNLGFSLGDIADAGEQLTAQVLFDGAQVGSIVVNNNSLAFVDGAADIALEQIPGLAFQAIDGDHLGAADVTLVVTSHDGDDQRVSSALVKVQVALKAPEPPVIDISANDVVTDEDVLKRIPLEIFGADSVTVTGLPVGAKLEDGINSFTAVTGGESINVSGWDLEELRILPAPHSDQRITLRFKAVVTENGVSSEAEGNLVVSVNAKADAPALSAPVQVSGNEDAASIPLQIVASEVDRDGSQETTARISGVLHGVLTHGTDLGGGVYSVPFNELGIVAFKPNSNWSGSDTLTVTVTSVEKQNGDEVSVAKNIAVNVVPVADIPTLTVPGAKAGDEDTAISLAGISGTLVDGDGSEELSFEISGVNGNLSAGNKVGGVWILQPQELAGLSLTPPADFSGTQDLTVRAVATEAANGDVAKSTPKVLRVVVNPVADVPNLSVSDVSGNEDSAINLSVTGGPKAGSGETVRYIFSNVQGALSTGANLGGNRWQLTQGQLDSGVRFTPTANFAGNVDVTVEAISKDGNSEKSISKSFRVTVAPVADIPNLSVSNVAGNEDNAIRLSVTGGPSASGESVIYEFSNVQGVLSVGAPLGSNRWRLTQAQLGGVVNFTPAADFSGSVGITVKAISSHGGSSASVEKSFTVTVNPVADTPVLNVTPNPTGDEDQWISLGISGGPKPGSGETVTYRFTGVAGTLNRGINRGSGTWDLSQADINAGVSYKGVANASGDDAITITATSHDGNDSKSVSQNIVVTVRPVPDAPSLSVQNAEGPEDAQLPVSITVSANGDPVSKVTISNVQGGAFNQYNSAANGVYDVTNKLSGLKFVPTSKLSGSYSFLVTATSSAPGGATATTSRSMTITVNEIPHQPSISFANASGKKQEAIPLTISPNFPDSQGEVHYLQITGMPTDATLNKGTNLGNGVWQISEAQGFSGISLTKNNAGLFTLTARACAQANSATLCGTAAAQVEVTGCVGRGCR